jgi:hypothetical protein
MGSFSSRIVQRTIIATRDAFYVTVNLPRAKKPVWESSIVHLILPYCSVNTRTACVMASPSDVCTFFILFLDAECVHSYAGECKPMAAAHQKSKRINNMTSDSCSPAGFDDKRLCMCDTGEKDKLWPGAGLLPRSECITNSARKTSNLCCLGYHKHIYSLFFLSTALFEPLLRAYWSRVCGRQVCGRLCQVCGRLYQVCGRLRQVCWRLYQCADVYAKCADVYTKCTDVYTKCTDVYTKCIDVYTKCADVGGGGAV